MSFKHVVLAVDLTEESILVANKAVEICKAFEADLTIIHVIESLNYAYGGDVPIDITDIQQQLQNAAHEKMTLLVDQLGIPVRETQVTQGGIESEIHRIAEDKAADLIVVGSHGRHGLALLLGSTANGVLHGAPCDVLAVRVNGNK
ncbi:universal stress protein [Maribrevibacterium harenarium]|jgi:universal stress protein A|uniref:Universal stress protein n=1 Tax=Maribrevibacterium harenarium TaxID=2589817 RepID=A0A501X5F9_9GAMM|nr:universal stress protein [Maribrevibacterium harenarium]TPE55683.1 universal stress protein [Maribrevibacterium harenarium]